MKEYKFMAAGYDVVLAPFLSGLRKKVLEMTREINPESVVDLCCGTGNQLKLLKKMGFSNVTCVDLSEDMLSIARKGKYSPECIQGDASDTGLASGSIDLVMISLALHEKKHESASAILSEAYRILKSGSSIIVSDFNISPDVRRYVRSTVTFIEFLAGGEHFQNYKAYVGNGGLRPLMEESPFKIKRSLGVAMGAISVEEWVK
jgi:demethylmenaquinone methyltransferase/2-methoxy-6-polyprenyl-1,4-benzoquinol methylase